MTGDDYGLRLSCQHPTSDLCHPHPLKLLTATLNRIHLPDPLNRPVSPNGHLQSSSSLVLPSMIPQLSCEALAKQDLVSRIPYLVGSGSSKCIRVSVSNPISDLRLLTLDHPRNPLPPTDFGRPAQQIARRADVCHLPLRFAGPTRTGAEPE